MKDMFGIRYVISHTFNALYKAGLQPAKTYSQSTWYNDLKNRVMNFISFYNETAKPFK
jgi:hypothetical protein